MGILTRHGHNSFLKDPNTQHVNQPIPLLIHTEMAGSIFALYYRIFCQEYYEGGNGAAIQSLVRVMDEQLSCHKRTKIRNDIVPGGK